MNDLFERSCAHWSEAKRRGMEDFYTLASEDYRHLAQKIDWRAWLERRQRAVGERPLRLLDVACGSGKFPTALNRHAEVAKATVLPIDYALLDPSEFSIREARGVLKPPFIPSAAFSVPLQELDCAEGAFDIVWATHALYALPAEELDLGVARFLRAMRGGVGVIAQACEHSHYVRFHKLYLEGFQSGVGAAFITAEDILASLARLGAEVDICDLAYENTAAETATPQVEGFLQRCVFDDAVSLRDLRAREPTSAYLAGCLTDRRWRFPQQVKLIFIRV